MSVPRAVPQRAARWPKTPVTWAARVEASGSAHEVVEVARDFLAQFSPYEMHALPAACMPPPKIVDEDDVAAYALVLVRYDCDELAAAPRIEHKMADFFSHAAARLAHLADDRPIPPHS